MGILLILLLLGAINAVGLAVLINRAHRNRHANRLLASLLVLVALRLGIYVLGFAGAYDQHRWLTFLPLDLSAGFAPLLWLYVRAIGGRLPSRWWVHLIPACVQFAYQLACFLLAEPVKWDWYTTGNLHVVEPWAMAAILLAAGCYVLACWRDQARYQRWLDTRFADREQWRLSWLRMMIAAFASLLLVAAGTGAWHLLIRPIDYFERTPVMFAFCLLAYLFGLLGWRHGDQTYPGMTEIAGDVPEARADYGTMAARFTRRIEAEGWWREEGLTLGEVARRLGTSERSLSRALNDGAGRSFNSSINAMRVIALQAAMIRPGEERDLLTLALDHGFASKASFNRAFREVAGTTPSQWRRNNRQDAMPADFGALG
ncbi:helix-turn-helix domain-containing protein [Xanthomonas phaseoli]|uniref:helix-turn-helix domain-containing protein n=1 Tax=Xanthomonas phaseoli TaxID=1985254 RepID=UPI0002E9F6FE|nr:AraC family transcriptional regulator [Xanthomonas phaseoli]